MASLQDTQQATQDKMDPRRFGRNNSGLSEEDVSNVICILHPSSQAAFDIVNDTAKRNPQHVLQNQGLTDKTNGESFTDASEADTILLQPTATAERPKDLALRFDSRVINPTLSFCFGRNNYKCDINLDPHGTQKRVSNVHFRIYLNSNGVLMLEDMSTNGTVIDNTSLGGKQKAGKRLIQKTPTSRMLNHGSVIEVLSPVDEEIVKFILRVPTRDRNDEKFAEKFRNYVQHVQVARDRQDATQHMPEAHARAVMAAPLAGPANTKAIPSLMPQAMSTGYQMHWDGGGRYNCVGLLGKGAFATVYQIATTYGGEYFAAKELDKKRFMKNNQLDTRIENEMNIMQELRHENIVQYMDFVETPTHLYIIMEYVAGGDLQGYMQSHGTLPEEMGQDMTRQILDALKYLHGKNVTHRDIKPDNILLCSEAPFVVKLTDFGLSKVVKNNETFLKTFCGTLLYCAPEVFPHYQNYMADKRTKRRRPAKDQGPKRSYSQLVDIWSYAAVLWTALCGNPPFEGVVDAEGKGMFYQIMQSPIDTTPLKECGVSDNACDLLTLMLDTDPTTRPPEADCLRHPWINGGNWAPEQEVETGALHAIDEREEVDIDASNLSIHDRHEPQADSAGSGDSMEIPEPKRTKPGQPSAAIGESVPLFQDAPQQQLPTPDPAESVRPRLFGEISQPALQSSGALNTRTGHFEGGYHDSQTNRRQSWNDNSTNSNAEDSRILNWDMEMSHTSGDENAHTEGRSQNWKGVNTSLSGATSMVRELQMADAPHTPSHSHSANTRKQNAESPGTKTSVQTPVNQAQGAKRNDSSQPSIDRTPKPRKPFERQISLPITASSYYDPYNVATHNVDYASRVSGHDFGVRQTAESKGLTSLPETVQPSYRSGEEPKTNYTDTSQDALEPELDANSHAQRPFEEQAVAGAHQNDNGSVSHARLLGRLVSTPDSFASVILPLQGRQTTWGRLQGTTITYSNPKDTRVPKLALELIFDAPGIVHAEAERRDWTTLPGLRLLILTRSSHGIWVNGCKLIQSDEQSRRYYGRLADGDIVEVFRPTHQASREEKPLKFIVEIKLEGAKWQRKDGRLFEVQKHSELS